jgi:hypothetical protein
MWPRDPAARRSGRWAVLQPLGPGFADSGHPLAARSLADTQGFGNPALGPTFRLEVPCLQAPRFLPILRDRVHA